MSAAQDDLFGATPAPLTRSALARVIRGTAGAGHGVAVTIANQAEGSTPRSVRALAQALSDDADAG